MNEYQIKEAAERHALHPVLGPATRTLVNLMTWTNSNSDGWPYWRKPAQAAAKLIALIEAASWHEDDPRYAEPTADAYRSALRPVKAFRTRQANDRGLLDREILFEIHEPGPGTGGEVWVAQLAYEDATKRWQALVARAEEARVALDQTRDHLEAAQRRLELADVRGQAASGADLHPQLAALARFDAGDRLWVLPSLGDGGLGTIGVVTGLVYRQGGACLTYRTPDGLTGREYRPQSLADARAAFWVLDPDWSRIRAGGWPDETRVRRVQESKFGECVIVQGSRFIPDPASLADTPAVTA